MHNELFHLATIYSFFQSLAVGVFCLGILFFLRRTFPLTMRILLIISASVFVGVFAESVSSLAGTSEGQSYFGALGAQIFGVVIFLKLTKTKAEDRAKTWEVFSLLSGVMYALLRVGCYFRGCCWGRLCPYPWAVYYKNSEAVTPWLYLPLHPVQLYSSFHGLLCSLGVALFIRYSSPEVRRASPASTLGVYLVLIGLGRLATDYFRADAAFYHQSWWGFFPNTVIATIAALAGFLILAFRRRF